MLLVVCVCVGCARCAAVGVCTCVCVCCTGEGDCRCCILAEREHECAVHAKRNALHACTRQLARSVGMNSFFLTCCRDSSTLGKKREARCRHGQRGAHLQLLVFCLEGCIKTRRLRNKRVVILAHMPDACLFPHSCQIC